MSDERGAARLRDELAHWGREPELNPLDALMWRTERPPADSWVGVVVLILGTTPSWRRMRAAHEWALGLVPRFSERVVEPLLPTGPPLWAADPNFDLRYHLRRTTLSGDGSMRDLMEFAQAEALTPLDRNRSPWQATFVDGLEGGRSAYVLHVHHVLMDGAAATQLFSRILDRAENQAAGDPPDLAEPVRASRASVTLRGIRWQAAGVRELVREGVGLARGVTKNPQRILRGARSYVESVPRVVTPPPPAQSALLQPGPRVKWRFGTLECELSVLRAASKQAGGTVNDAFVCAILGGLRAYHERHGEEMGDIPMSMPVSMRRDDDPMGGNRFTGAFFTAPSGVRDPAQRIGVMHDRVEVVRGEAALDIMGSISPALNLAPSLVVSAALGGLAPSATLTTSSWRGVPFDTYFAGAKFERMFVFGPLPGTVITAALCTHKDLCCIGVNVDGDVIEDDAVLWECLQEGLDDVLALASSPG